MHIDKVQYQPKTAADELSARLRVRLFDGAFAPDEVISIRRIAEAEGVSVIPARDALRGLVAEGALVFRDARTIAVPVLDSATLDELRYARLALETELADRAFASLRDDIDALEQLDDAVTTLIISRNVAGYMHTNRAFHFRIYRAAGAPVLHRLVETLWLRIGPSMRFICEAYDGMLPSTDYHQVALGALRSGDRSAFRAALQADISQGMDEIPDRLNPVSDQSELEGQK